MDFLYLFPRSIQPGAGGGLALDWGGAEPFRQARALEARAAIAFPLVIPGAFAPEECERVIALGAARTRQAGAVDQRSDLESRDYRVSEIAWIEPDADAQWLYHRLAVLFAQANAAYGFELVGFAEALQFTAYGAGQYFAWHADLGPGDTAARKLSMTLQLSDPQSYDGGALQFHGGADMPVARSRGCATFFPAYLAHRVAPVESGRRLSLVAWAYGPAFR